MTSPVERISGQGADRAPASFLNGKTAFSQKIHPTPHFLGDIPFCRAFPTINCEGNCAP
jgi:hypothetical protein